MKKILVLLLALALALVTMSFAIAEDNLTPWGLDKSEPIVVTIYTPDANMTKDYQRFSETEVGAYILDKFNIDFEFFSYTETNIEKQNLLLVAGEYPDLIYMEGATVRASYVDAEALLDLEPYLEKMTNFANYYSKQLPYWRALTPDGHIHFWQGDGIPAGWGGWSGNGIMVRADAVQLYFDKYGAEHPPVFLSDFVEMLTLAKDANFVNIHGEPTIGLTGCFGESYGLRGIAQGSAENSHYVGSSNRFMTYDLDTDSYLPYHETDFLKDAFRFFNKLWQIGMLDEECFTMMGGSLVELEKTGTPIAVWYTTWDAASANASLVAAGHPEMQYIAFAVVPDTYNQEGYLLKYGSSPVNDFSNYGISAKTEYAERLCEYIDWCCSEEGQQILRNGIEGTHWERDAEGNRVVIEENYVKRAIGYEEYDENYAILTGIGNNAIACGLISANTIAEDGVESTITATDLFKTTHVNTEAPSYKFFTAWGWSDNLSWLREHSVLMDMVRPNSVEFETGSEYAQMQDDFTEIRIRHIFDLWTADSDEAFDAEWQAMLDEYAQYDVGGFVKAYNELAYSVSEAGTAN